jgi:hypothetical protein
MEDLEIQEENIQTVQETKNKELEMCLLQMKELRDQLKETQSFQDYGYVLK